MAAKLILFAEKTGFAVQDLSFFAVSTERRNE
jgi:hypothetical protein